jgi:uncharacterized alkaline shock family protein YloU
MAAKKETSSALPLATENDTTPSAKITYANEVVAIIAGLAANEVEGIAGMCSVGGSILNKNRNVTKGVKVEIGTEEAAVDLYVIVEYGTPIQRAAMDAQENVRKAIESMTGLHVVRVDVHVQGVSFEQENKALQSGAESAALVAGEAEPEKLAEPVTEETKETAKPEEENKPARPRNKNTRSKKETPKAEEEAAPETEKAPEEDKPSEEA